MKHLFASIIVIRASLLTGPCLGQAGYVPAPIVCENKDNIEEPACATKLKGMFERNGDKLTLKLFGGVPKRMLATMPRVRLQRREVRRFRITRYFPQTRSFLVTKGYYEGADYLFVNQLTGSEIVVSDILAVSPKAKFLVAIDQNDAGERDFDIAVWSMESDPPNPEFKYKAKQYENWEIIGWQDDTRIAMKAWVNDTTSYDQEAELVRTGSGWTLVLGKKTDRPQ